MLYPYLPQWQPPRKVRPAHVMIFGPSKLSFLQFAIRCDDRLASGMSSKAIDNEKAKYEFGEQI